MCLKITWRTFLIIDMPPVVIWHSISSRHNASRVLLLSSSLHYSQSIPSFLLTFPSFLFTFSHLLSPSPSLSSFLALIALSLSSLPSHPSPLISHPSSFTISLSHLMPPSFRVPQKYCLCSKRLMLSVLNLLFDRVRT